MEPLLAVFKNDIDKRFNRDTSKFSEDTNIGCQMISKEDTINVLDELDKLLLWSEKWQMHLSADKYKVLILGIENIYDTYNIDLSEAD